MPSCVPQSFHKGCPALCMHASLLRCVTSASLCHLGACKDRGMAGAAQQQQWQHLLLKSLSAAFSQVNPPTTLPMHNAPFPTGYDILSGYAPHNLPQALAHVRGPQSARCGRFLRRCPDTRKDAFGAAAGVLQCLSARVRLRRPWRASAATAAWESAEFPCAMTSVALLLTPSPKAASALVRTVLGAAAGVHGATAVLALAVLLLAAAARAFMVLVALTTAAGLSGWTSRVQGAPAASYRLVQAVLDCVHLPVALGVKPVMGTGVTISRCTREIGGPTSGLEGVRRCFDGGAWRFVS